MKKILFILIALLRLSAIVVAQHTKPEDKIDIFFNSLMKKQQQSIAKTHHSKNTIVQKKYECIIYTKHAKALRDRNIIINSELPNFVTAVVTLKQIQQLSLMKEVTFIEAPKTNMIH